MTITNGYCTLAELQLHLEDDDAEQQTRYERIITSTSRAIDEYCNQFFYDTGSASARTFHAAAWDRVETPPFSTTTGLIVATDDSNTGTYGTTWTITTDYVALEPYKSSGRAVPYNEIAAVGTRFFPWVPAARSFRFRRQRVQITARWGWSAVPPEVKEACLIKAARLARRKDAPEGEFGGFGAIGTFKIADREDPDVASLLSHLRNQRGMYVL